MQIIRTLFPNKETKFFLVYHKEDNKNFIIIEPASRVEAETVSNDLKIDISWLSFGNLGMAITNEFLKA